MLSKLRNVGPVDSDSSLHYDIETTIDEEDLDLQPCEYVFLLDRSGSMMGRSIQLAIEALKLALHP